MSTNLRTELSKLLPRWLSSGAIERVMYTVGLHADALAQASQWGVLVGFPGAYPEGGALWRHGAERALPQWPGEPDVAYAARLVHWLDTHATSGTMPTLMSQIQGIWTDWTGGVVSGRAKIEAVEDDGTHWVLLPDGTWDTLAGSSTPWQWDQQSPGGSEQEAISRYWVVIHPTASQLAEIPTSGASRGTSARAAPTFAAIRQFGAPHSACSQVIIVRDEDGWGEVVPVVGRDWTRWLSRSTAAWYWADHPTAQY